jgi:L-threonylcarbamoyladenylate synthase
MVETPRVLPASEATVEEAVAVLRRGGLVAIPTETVYGLAADASDPAAVRRVFEVKRRPADHPLIVHLGAAERVGEWAASVPPVAQRLADVFWPGPLTLVLPRGSRVPDVVTGGRPTVGLRVPDQALALAVLERFGGGLAAPSANRFGRVSPTRAAHVVADLGDEVDLVLDGGSCRLGVESTIVEVVDDRVAVLRPGALTVEQLEEVAGHPVELDHRGPARAPGMLPEHYAPAAQVVLTDDPAATAARYLDLGHRVAVLAETRPPGLPAGVRVLDPVGSPEGYARHLYERLREADRSGVDVVVAVAPAPVGVGRAVRDRLERAARSST